MFICGERGATSPACGGGTFVKNMGQHRQLEMFANNTNSVHPMNMQDLCSNMLQQHGRPIQQVSLRAAWQTVVEVVFKAAGQTAMAQDVFQGMLPRFRETQAKSARSFRGSCTKS